MRYGDSYLEVRPVSEVRPFTEFQIELRPRDAGIVGKKVEVKGNEDDEDAGWIDGSSDDQKEMPEDIITVGCVPKDAVEGTEYKFDVVVDDVGLLDPRARIVK